MASIVYMVDLCAYCRNELFAYSGDICILKKVFLNIHMVSEGVIAMLPFFSHLGRSLDSHSCECETGTASRDERYRLQIVFILQSHRGFNQNQWYLAQYR
jgi:hypothetical protein